MCSFQWISQITDSEIWWRISWFSILPPIHPHSRSPRSDWDIEQKCLPFNYCRGWCGLLPASIPCFRTEESQLIALRWSSLQELPFLSWRKQPCPGVMPLFLVATTSDDWPMMGGGGREPKCLGARCADWAWDMWAPGSREAKGVRTGQTPSPRWPHQQFQAFQPPCWAFLRRDTLPGSVGARCGVPSKAEREEEDLTDLKS